MKRFGADERGQTLQDYVMGIGVFLVAVVFVFSLLPSIFAPYQSPIESHQVAQSQRISNQAVESLTEGDSRHLNTSRTTDYFSAGESPTDAADLRTRYGLRSIVNVNVTLQTVESQPNLYVGDPVEDHAVAASMRVLADDGTVCRPTCRLIVRIW